MRNTRYILLFTLLITTLDLAAQSQPSPNEIKFVRQGVKRMIFDREQSIHLAGIEPKNIIGLPSMHPVSHYTSDTSNVFVREDKLPLTS
ncbi:MAG: hypothetical protein H7X84_05935 [Verrucomicrobia bacterium]|nr:hypothetical protein [Prolixibacteraceae bacterium]